MYKDCSLKIWDLAPDTENVCDFCSDNGEMVGAKFGADLGYHYTDYPPHAPYYIPYWVCRKHLIDLTENYRDMDR